MSVFFRSTLIFTVILVTSASQTLHRFQDAEPRVLIIGRVLFSGDGGSLSMTDLMLTDLPEADPRAFPSSRLADARWWDWRGLSTP